MALTFPVRHSCYATSRRPSGSWTGSCSAVLRHEHDGDVTYGHGVAYRYGQRRPHAYQVGLNPSNPATATARDPPEHAPASSRGRIALLTGPESWQQGTWAAPPPIVVQFPNDSRRSMRRDAQTARDPRPSLGGPAVTAWRSGSRATRHGDVGVRMPHE